MSNSPTRAASKMQRAARERWRRWAKKRARGIRQTRDRGGGGRLGCHRHTRDTSSTTPPCPPQITTLRNPRIHLTRTHSDTVLYTLVALSRSRVPPRRASMRSRSSNTLFHDPIWEDL
ncbi:hypothetical protein CABS01_08431 [Colletotrichum abscissum]|uniref:uncharacterized protein n=1 Tax=Colletotrichum abscissum TaxID=1671311 RepID=UPI0027D6F715|nr:uncharacterized protein CABS01_08431 [Colletotrichum abscissum]KAK1507251.1 hypothetical protein CABS01_08431 [Colletotrichum abscissum]